MYTVLTFVYRSTFANNGPRFEINICNKWTYVFSELSEKTDDNVTTWKTTFSKDFTEVEEIARLISSKFK